MLHEHVYDGEVIKSTTDTQSDKFGSGRIIKTTCTSIKVVETAEKNDYSLDGCEKVKDNTGLLIWK
ncbi:hypothetical protein P4452_18215 [Cytobacillus praedii]|nr:hypothetical protein [Cytobacillus praedii]